MKFLIDANLGRRFTNLLNRAGYDVVLIKDLLPKALDEDVLFLAEREERIVITNDKDFGELIFKLGKSTYGVILLRMLTAYPDNRFEMIKGILNKAQGKFVVVREGRVRIRELK